MSHAERIAFEQWLGIKPIGAAHDLAWAAWKARASLPAPQQATPEPCKPCDGMGYVDGVGDACAECGGQGATPEPVGEPLGYIPTDAINQIKTPPRLITINVPVLSYAADGYTAIYTRPAPGVQEGLPAVLTDWGFDVHDDEEGRTWLTIRNPDDDVARMSVPTVWPLNGNQTISAVVLHQFSAALTSALAAAQAKGAAHD